MLVGSLHKNEKRRKIVATGQSFKPQEIKTKPEAIHRQRLPAIPFIFVSPPIFEEISKMSAVPEHSNEDDLLSFSDGMRDLDEDRFQLKSGRKRKAKPKYNKDSKQSFERFIVFDF